MSIGHVPSLLLLVSDYICMLSAHVFCSQQLMILSRDKSIKLAHLYSRVDWLERYSASVGLRQNEATTQASKIEARAHGLELELTRANGERDMQRAMAKQKAKEAELQVAALCMNVEALAARTARS